MIRWFTLFIAMVVTSIASATVIYPPGSRIGIEPPAGMEISNRFPGFENIEKQTSVTIVELPAIAYDKAISDLAKDELKRQGLVENIRQNFKVGGRDALLVGGVQSANGERIRKWIVVAGDETTTAFLIAQAPEGRDAYSQNQIISALKSATFRAPLTLQQQVDSLPFTVGDLSGFRIIRVARVVGGDVLVLTDGPKDNNLDGEQPLVIIGVAMGGPPSAASQDAFARQALISAQNLRNIQPERAEGFRLNGDDWYEIVARAVDTATARPVIVMQTLRFRGGGHLRMLATVKAENRTGTLSRFLNIINSTEFKD